MAVIVGYVVISYYVAYVAKTLGAKKKWLPVVAATTGLLCGIVGYIAGVHTDLIDALALGLFSGFSAVGTNEIAKYVFLKRED